MYYRSQIYDLLLNNQDSILELLNILNVGNPKEKIKNILDEQYFEILSADKYEIISIKKKSTGEVFKKGDKFYHIKYKKWIEYIYFDEALLGTYYSDSFYKNYVRGDGGLYHLYDISTADKKKNKKSELPEEIMIGGITYQLKKY